MKIGVPADLFCYPLRRVSALSADCELVTDDEKEIARQLGKRRLSIALVSPYEFSRESSEYLVLPGCAATSKSAVSLHFREHLHDIRSVAVDPSRISEIILSRIVLAEQFEITPAVVPVSGESLEKMLLKADAALLTGDAYLRYHRDHLGNINLAELWSEMTDLPYVHAFCCTRMEEISLRELSFFASMGKDIAANWDAILQSAQLVVPDIGIGTIRNYLESFSYEMNDETSDGILEFLQYAHYYGMIPDIPELRFISPSSDDQPVILTPSN